ncbi:unnamed protein product [Brassicogethes aeneus]|uniref:Uncharacterized protein n=1 Tax=Brassicogethes aeneus TaxID=1431903 RepID=A0A9P0ASL6_BRAAE|nr:unnamed protein product [Brassicogethes aeneus]
MGNKLCKKKVDTVDNVNNMESPPNTFDRIINRLHLRPNSWKSESHLNQKQVNRLDEKQKGQKDRIVNSKPLSKSTDWTNIDLEVPDKEQIHLRNPKLALIFNNDEGTPTPPPRKNKKGFREKIEAVAKSGLQAFQSKKPVEEELFVKKKINYSCPYCDGDEASHNRDHKHHHKNKKHDIPNEKEIERMIVNNNAINKDKQEKEIKRKKNLSVVSLPNYNDLKFTIANFNNIDKQQSDRNSITSLSESKKQSSTKLDNYITRCRSFGSIFPQQIMEKLKTSKKIAEIESDDSFGPLEDWDLKIIEHYNPKDASLPRTRKIPGKNVLAELEGMIVQEEDIANPIPPARKTESILKNNKMQTQTLSKSYKDNMSKESNEKSLVKPPSTLEVKKSEILPSTNRPSNTEGADEHSTLMKILEKFSMKSVLDDETIPHIDDDEDDVKLMQSQYKQGYVQNGAVSPNIQNTVKEIDMFIQSEASNTAAELGVKY